MRERIFKDREHAGHLLAEQLQSHRDEPGVVVVALAPQGLPVAKPIADRLCAKLDAISVRKILDPSNSDYPVGAVTARGVRILDETRLRETFLPPGTLEEATEAQLGILKRREAFLRRYHPPVPLVDRTVILVDDGAMSGLTMRAAIADVRDRKPEAIFVAVPVAPLKVVKALHDEAERVIVFEATDDLDNVYEAYEHFPPVSDPDAAELLAEHIRCLRFPYA